MRLVTKIIQTFIIRASEASRELQILSSRQARRIKSTIFFIFLTILSSSAFATPADLGEIEVVAPDTTPAKDSSAASKVISPTDEQNKSTAQIIEQAPGVHLKRYGSNDDTASISIRGAPANQLETYYDNVPLNSAAGNMLSLSIAPPENLSKIEIYRGGAPGKAKDSSPAGAIFLQTLKRPEKFTAKLYNSYGSFNTYTGNLQLAAPFKKHWTLLSFEHAQSAGDFTYDNNGTLTKRQNNDYKNENLLLKYGYDNDVSSFEISNTLLLRRQGVPGLGAYQSTNARLNTDRDITIINANYENNRFTAFFDYLNDRFSDPNGEIGLSVQDNSDYTYRAGGEYSRAFDLGKYNKLFVSGSYTGEMYIPHNYAVANSTGTTSMRDQIGAVVEDTLSLFNEKLVITPSGRFTTVFNNLSGNDPSDPTNVSNTSDLYQLTGKIGAKVRALAGLYFKGNFYRGYRNPTFSELFGDRGMFIGNPALKPEKATNFDLGVSYELEAIGRLDRLKIEATYFRNLTNDLIQFLQTSQFTAKPQNLASARIQGFEASAQVNYLGHISHSLSYTFQDARDTSNLVTAGKVLPGRPKNEVWFDSSLYNEWGKIFGEYNFMSGSFLDTQNLLEVTARTLLNAGVTAVPAKWITINATVKNITNDHIVDVLGFPLPGRSYWGAITLRI